MGESAGRSCFVAGAMYFGAICLLITLIAAINLSLSLNLAVSFSGASVDLPNDWIAIAILGFLGATTLALGILIGSDSVIGKIKEKPLVLIPIILVFLLGGYSAYVQIDYQMYGGKYPWAAANGRVDVLEQYFSSKEVKQEEKNGLLKLAIVYKAPKAAAWLLNKGADVNGRDERNIPMLSLAVWQSTEEIVDLLLEKGADVNAEEPTLQRTPLMYLVSYRPNVAGHDRNRIEEQQKSIIGKLVAKGAKKSVKDKFNKTAAEIAKQEGRTSLLPFLK